MSSTRKEPPGLDRKNQERGLLEAVVGDNVMDDLGRPAGLRQVQVRPLWDNTYRVNVFVGGDAATVKVAHSFFLTADRDGKILSSSPAITREY